VRSKAIIHRRCKGLHPLPAVFAFPKQDVRDIVTTPTDMAAVPNQSDMPNSPNVPAVAAFRKALEDALKQLKTQPPAKP
jgi:hypothetical protein